MDLLIGRRLSSNNCLKIFMLGFHCGISKRLNPNVLPAFIVDWLISESIYPEKFGELKNAFAAIWVVFRAGALGNDWTICQQIFVDCLHIDGVQFRIEVLDEPIDSYIIAVVLFPHYFPHFLQQLYLGIVEIHEVATHKGDSYQANGKHFTFFCPSICKTMVLRILEVSNSIGDYWPHIPNCILLPHFESSLQLLAIDYYVIINDKKYFCFALGRNCISPIH